MSMWSMLRVPVIIVTCLACVALLTGQFRSFRGDRIQTRLSDCSARITQGLLCMDTDDNTLHLGTGVSEVIVGSGAGGGSWPDGTEAAPGNFFTDDTDTGVFSLADDSFSLGAGAVEFLTLSEVVGQDILIVNDDGDDIDLRVEASGVTDALFIRGSDGNVGLRTTTPGNTLEIGVGGIDINTNNVSTIRQRRAGGLMAQLMILDSGDNLIIGNGTNVVTSIAFQTVNGQVVRTVGPNTGFGDSGPDTRVEVLDTTTPQFRITHTDAVDDLDFSVDANGDATIEASGNDITLGDANGDRVTVNSHLATVATSITLGVGVTTFALTSNVMTVTGDAGANTLATITGATSGQYLIMIFVDGLVTITDDNTHAANSVDLSAAFTGADDTTLHLIYDGTSWYEVARSTN